MWQGEVFAISDCLVKYLAARRTLITREIPPGNPPNHMALFISCMLIFDRSLWLDICGHMILTSAGDKQLINGRFVLFYSPK